jgi:hypothetical protein
MANGTSTSHVRPTVAEVLESPDRHEAYLAEMAAWAHGWAGGPDTVTITGNARPAPTRRQVADALLDEAGWLAERLTAARAAEPTPVAHLLVFTGLGTEPATLSEVRAELCQGLLRQGIVVGDLQQNYPAGPSPWPGFILRASTKISEVTDMP